MKLSDRLINVFDPASRRKGEELFRRHAVRLSQGSSRSFDGEVQGTLPYQVSISLTGDTLALSCECPYFDQEGYCKHLWAVVLEAEKRGLLSEIANAADLEVAEAEVRPEAIYTPRPTDQFIPRVPLWQDHLQAIQRGLASSSKQLPESEIFYIIDDLASRAQSELVIELQSRYRKKNGEWTAPRELRISADQLLEITDPIDQDALASILGGSESYSHQYSQRVRKTLPAALAKRLIPILAPTGRLKIKTGGLSAHTDTVAWDPGEPWAFRLEVRPANQDQWALTGVLVRGDQRMPLAEPLLVLEAGFVFTRAKVARLEYQGGFEWIRNLRLMQRVAFPDYDREAAVSRLLESPSLPPLDLDEALRFNEQRIAPRPGLRIKQAGNEFQATLLLDYGRGWVGQNPNQRGFYFPEEKLYILRDLAAEDSAREKLHSLGLRAPADPRGPWRLGPKMMPRAVHQLLQDGWHVDAEGKLFRRSSAKRLEVRSGIDWFELRGKIEYDGQEIDLPQLISALRRGDGIVQLGDGTVGMLPEEWLQQFAPLFNLGELDGDHLRFRPNQATLLDALLAAQPEVEVDAVFQQARQRLHEFQGVRIAPQPAGFCGELREYQREGLGWIAFLREFGFGGCLADDMGVGKTAQVLAALETRRAEGCGPSLVVAPRSLMFNWKQESERFTPQLKVLEYTGNSRSTEGFAEHNLILTTYGTLVRDAAALTEFEFDYVVLDEAQATKNSSTATAKAVRLLRGKHRLALSGTPIENHLGELWSIFEFLNPGMLGEAKTLRLAGGLAQNPGQDSRLLLAQALRPFILRRTKKQVARELPEKTEQTILCEFDPTQRRQYDELRDFYRKKLLGQIDRDGLNNSKMHVLEALLRLRQAACHPGLLDPKRLPDPSPKIDTLIGQLHELREEGHKALVFSQFTSLLSIVRGRLDADGMVYEYLDGATNDRKSHVERFQNDPGCGLFLISLKAGGLGLNLTAAEYVFLLDPWWNPAVEAQAIDRAHRIGQSRPVFAYRLITKDTVEERVLELQKTKRDLADAILGEDNSLIRNLQREDLELLLS